MSTDEPPAWLAELTFTTHAPWLTVGTRAVGAGAVVSPAPDAVAARKAALLERAHDVVAVALPGHQPEAGAVAQAVAGALRRPLDSRWPALEAAARLVAEDLVVLARRDGTWRMVAGVVCFPSHWRPAEKLGLPVAAIHAPVPYYEAELAGRVDRLLDRLAPARAVWRRNWMIHASSELHAPDPVPAVGPTAVGEGWLRSERQGLVRLGGSGAVLFAIRTDTTPLALVKADRVAAGGLADALDALPPELVGYRVTGVDAGPLAEWLRR